MKALFKKAFCFFLTAMITAAGMIALSRSETRAAEDEGSITINNTTNGVTYTPYKIFDTNISGEQNSPASYGYSIRTDSPWLGWLTSHPDTASPYLIKTRPSGTAGKDYEQIDVVTNDADGKGSRELYYFTVSEDNVIAFANAAQQALAANEINAQPAAEGKTSTADGQSLVFENLPLGYYIVSPSGTNVGSAVSGGAIANLTTNAPDRTISPKSTKPTIEKSAEEPDHAQKTTTEINGKAVNDLSVSVGDTEKFTLTGYLPDTAGYSSYKYELTDTMTNLNLVRDGEHPVTAAVNGQALDSSLYEASGENGKAGLQISFKVKEIGQAHPEWIGEAITVTYFARITPEAAATGSAENSVVLTYGPDGKEKTDKTTVNFTTTQLKIVKLDNSAAPKPLANAQFTLQQNGGGNQYFAGTATTQNSGTQVTMAQWAADPATFATGSDGTLLFKGLEAGSYLLQEVKAPDGYSLLANPVRITIDRDGKVTFTGDYQDTLVKIDENSANVQVTNITGGHLPETGGTGTALLYAAGGILVAAAAVILITRKRMGTKP